MTPPPFFFFLCENMNNTDILTRDYYPIVYGKEFYAVDLASPQAYSRPTQLDELRKMTQGLPYPIGLLSSEGYDDFYFGSQEDLLKFLSSRQVGGMILERCNGHLIPSFSIYQDVLGDYDDLSILSLHPQYKRNDEVLDLEGLDKSIEAYCFYDPLQKGIPKYFSRAECLEISSKWAQKYYKRRKDEVAWGYDYGRIDLIQDGEGGFSIRIDGIDTPFAMNNYPEKLFVTMVDTPKASGEISELQEKVEEYQQEYPGVRFSFVSDGNLVANDLSALLSLRGRLELDFPSFFPVHLTKHPSLFRVQGLPKRDSATLKRIIVANDSQLKSRNALVIGKELDGSFTLYGASAKKVSRLTRLEPKIKAEGGLSEINLSTYEMKNLLPFLVKEYGQVEFYKLPPTLQMREQVAQRRNKKRSGLSI